MTHAVIVSSGSIGNAMSLSKCSHFSKTAAEYMAAELVLWHFFANTTHIFSHAVNLIGRNLWIITPILRRSSSGTSTHMRIGTNNLIKRLFLLVRYATFGIHFLVAISSMSVFEFQINTVRKCLDPRIAFAELINSTIIFDCIAYGFSCPWLFLQVKVQPKPMTTSGQQENYHFHASDPNQLYWLHPWACPCLP